MNIRILQILLLAVMGFYFSSCVDEMDFRNTYGDGNVILSGAVNFYETPVRVSRAGEDGANPVTGGTPGNAIGNVSSLYVVVYQANGVLFNVYDQSQLDDYNFNPTGNNGTSPDHDANTSDYDSSASRPHQAERVTGRATFKIGATDNSPQLPYGKYRIYAVANVDLSTLKYANESELKENLLNWNDNVASNNAMFGYFTLDSDGTTGVSSGFDAPDLNLNRQFMTIHSWIKRAVSKVTVAFDGRKLYPGVEIFIKSVEIRDIPKECYLGAINTPVADEQLIDKSQIMTYGKGESYNADWIGYISKSHPINGYDQSVVDNVSLSDDAKLNGLHSEDTNAFYFFENMQGKGKPNTASDKHQQVNDVHKNLGVVSFPNGSDPTDNAWKDTKKYGTYIVVRAHYKSNNDDEGEGEIIYRFMLGKDTYLNYDAQRNYHYKLTLCFNGYANDVDWHIDYQRGDEPVRVLNPFYISYLYGQSGMMPIEIDAPEDVKIEWIKATITSNNWAPFGASAYAMNINDGSQPQNSNWWFSRYWLYLGDMDKPETYKYNGFLSLRKPSNLIVVTNPNGVNGTNFPLARNSNEQHYVQNKLGERTYTADELAISKSPVYIQQDLDQAHVAWEDGTYYVKLPIWTRARMLIKESGYTGNNPYAAYFRQAKVKLEIKLSNSDKPLTTLVTPDGKRTDKIDVRQVRRLVNPKGVWRKSGNNESFHAVLKVLEDEKATMFTNLKSDGPWRAYVIRDTEFSDHEIGTGGFVSLTGARGTMTGKTTFMLNKDVMQRDCIEGVGNSDIDFTINFKGSSTKPRYAVVRVEYNNYTCYHLIFIRQGYEADDTFGDGNRWMTTNNISQNEVGSDPRDEGSMFRYGNWGGIPSSLNVNGKTPWVNITPNDFVNNALGGKTIRLTNGERKTFDNITNIYDKSIVKKKGPNGYDVFDRFVKPASQVSFPKPSGMRVARHDDFYGKLAPVRDNDHDFHIKTGVGVLYADGATETANTIQEAYGYKAGGPVNYGMRGIFVYDTKTGKNLFFPIGSSGYGHRKNSLENPASNVTYRGVLRYNMANRWGYFNAVNSATYVNGVYDAPLFLDIFRSAGALYWYGERGPIIDEIYDKDSKGNPTNLSYVNCALAWDMNYKTFDFNHITDGNLDNGNDACFVRCIAD